MRDVVRLAETFTSIQGEGELSGVPMYFVRLSGCSVSKCPLHPATGGACDTDWAFRRRSRIDDVISEVPRGIHWVCITGGEPTDQLASVLELTRRTHDAGKRVMLQTSGIREVPDVFDWLVVSPKMPSWELKQTHGHELKLVWNGQDHGILRGYELATKFMRYYLMPLWTGDGCNIDKTAEVVQRCGEFGEPWRLTIQQHKYAMIP